MYSIASTILDAVARQIMRLTDSTEKVKPEEFEAKLASVSKGAQIPEGGMVYFTGNASCVLSGNSFNCEGTASGAIS